MADGLSECVKLKAALAAAEEPIAGSAVLKAAKIIVAQPAGVPAGSVTVVAYARAPRLQMARKSRTAPTAPFLRRGPAFL